MTSTTIDLINDLHYKLTFRDRDDCLANDLNKALEHIVMINVLDENPNVFASFPKNYPPLIGRAPISSKGFKQFVESVYFWIPEKEIALQAFIARCLHNLSDEGIDNTRVCDIKSALLNLKEQGKLELSDEGTIKKL